MRRIRDRLLNQQPCPSDIAPVSAVSSRYVKASPSFGSARPSPSANPRAPLVTLDAGAWKGQAAFILGGGPSLPLDVVPRLKSKGRVIAVNSAYTIAPDADILIAPDRRWWEWNAPRLHEYKGGLMIARQEPNYPRACRLRWDRSQPLSRDPAAMGGVCGGAHAINIAYLMGANPIILLGFDMQPGNWHSLHQMPHVEGQHRNNFIPAIERMAVELMRDNVTVINTNKRSALRCFGFADIEELLSMDDLAKLEADKYRRIWDRPEYRKVSPGMQEVERAHMLLEMRPAETLNDYGAGTARATLWFAGQGMDVLAIDHVTNAQETGVPFQQACLWDMHPSLRQSDYAFCCDVMEHIPPAQVDAVLAGIAKRTKKAAYFRIATRHDRCGALIGEKLHLTVEDGDFWRRALERYFPLVDVVEDNGRDIILIGRP